MNLYVIGETDPHPVRWSEGHGLVLARSEEHARELANVPDWEPITRVSPTAPWVLVWPDDGE